MPNPGPGRCVHCLKDVQHRDWDHVLPVSWYPNTTPADLEKWKVPSCIPCNKSHGKNEQGLLLALAFALDPKDPAAAGIIDTARRAIDPARAKNARDAHHRFLQRQKLGRMAKHLQHPPPRGVFPNFGKRKESSRTDTCLPIPDRAVRQLTEKIVRGLVFLEHGAFVEPEDEITISFMQNTDGQFLLDLAAGKGGVIHRGPGLTITRAYFDAPSRSGAFVIEIWGRCRLCALLAPRDLEERARAEREACDTMGEKAARPIQPHEVPPGRSLA